MVSPALSELFVELNVFADAEVGELLFVPAEVGIVLW